MAIHTNPLPKLTRIETAYFWASTTWQGSCLVWTGKTDRDGYGVFKAGGRTMRANRMAYLLAYGRDPGRLLVCHHCDVPSCCNPGHIYAGTSADNLRDSHRRQRRLRKYTRRTREEVNRGTRNPRAKLTDQQVLVIYKTNKLIAHNVLAQKYKVSKTTTGKIRRGIQWRHITNGVGQKKRAG